jgi:hypothetical protein
MSASLNSRQHIEPLNVARLVTLNYGRSSFATAEPPDAGCGVQAGLAALPPSEYLLTTAVAAEMGDYGSDRHYELVLDQFPPAPTKMQARARRMLPWVRYVTLPRCGPIPSMTTRSFAPGYISRAAAPETTRHCWYALASRGELA